jgi:hypothetical protein
MSMRIGASHDLPWGQNSVTTLAYEDHEEVGAAREGGPS